MSAPDEGEKQRLLRRRDELLLVIYNLTTSDDKKFKSILPQGQTYREPRVNVDIGSTIEFI